MTDPPLAVEATGLSAAAMYVACLRPIRRDRSHTPATDPAHAEVARLRREVADLREHTSNR